MEQTYTYEDLKTKTVEQLREIAAGLGKEAVQGYTQLNKEHLLEALCKALNIAMHAKHVVKDVEKTAIKMKIKKFKKKRDEAVNAHDRKQVKFTRRRIHRLKRDLHKAAA